ncbi:hypothetical protein F4553_004210 [Allocatelliglobosispora scoriae]|uniref:Uncharacterized protein n=1 Tax=Allocatelliglobosispora scoriae TaxID=643052 RepID=A0A841BVR3_9ACTN|nr:hypothetical protein [Allocatelliglobosispora scoriae]MBB5870831.1 hypothetical protein [Allocatelliglobosispora scoriae]
MNDVAETEIAYWSAINHGRLMDIWITHRVGPASDCYTVRFRAGGLGNPFRRQMLPTLDEAYRAASGLKAEFPAMIEWAGGPLS